MAPKKPAKDIRIHCSTTKTYCHNIIAVEFYAAYIGTQTWNAGEVLLPSYERYHGGDQELNRLAGLYIRAQANTDDPEPSFYGYRLMYKADEIDTSDQARLMAKTLDQVGKRLQSFEQISGGTHDLAMWLAVLAPAIGCTSDTPFVRRPESARPMTSWKIEDYGEMNAAALRTWLDQMLVK